MGLRGEFARIVVIALTIEIAASMDPDQDGQLSAASRLWRENVEVEAVLIGVWRTSKRPKRSDLGTVWAEMRRLPSFSPLRVRVRQPATQGVNRSWSIRDAQRLC